jgi:hypothetical protein
MFGYTGPCEFSDVIVIVLIGEPVGALAELAAVELVAPALAVLLDELEPHAERTSAQTMPAVASTPSDSRRVGGAPLLSRPCMYDLLMGCMSAAENGRA